MCPTFHATNSTDESGDEDDKDVAEMDNLFDDLQLANQQL